MMYTRTCTPNKRKPKDKKHIMINNLLEQTETQEKQLSSFDLELCKKMKKSVEDQYALLTLKKDVLPITRWYVIDAEGKQVDICTGDYLDHIEFEQCFDLKNNYLGTIRSVVLDTGPKHVRLGTPERTAYLMGEGNKIFGIYKPLTEKAENMRKLQKILSVTILLFILILILCGFMIL